MTLNREKATKERQSLKLQDVISKGVMMTRRRLEGGQEGQRMGESGLNRLECAT